MKQKLLLLFIILFSHLHIIPNINSSIEGRVVDEETQVGIKGVIVKVEEWGNQRLAYEVKKFDKGYYVLVKKDNPPYTHNLTYLAEQSGIYAQMKEEQKSLLDILEPLNVEARYPTHKEQLMRSLSQKKCNEIIEKTEGLFQWIKQQLSDA